MRQRIPSAVFPVTRATRLQTTSWCTRRAGERRRTPVTDLCDRSTARALESRKVHIGGGGTTATYSPVFKATRLSTTSVRTCADKRHRQTRHRLRASAGMSPYNLEEVHIYQRHNPSTVRVSHLPGLHVFQTLSARTRCAGERPVPRASPEPVSRLQDHDRPPGGGEISRGRYSGEAAADDRDVMAHGRKVVGRSHITGR